MIDETPDVSEMKQFCIILRYFDQYNDVVDCFVGFVDFSANRTAEVLTKIIIDFLIDYKYCTKLIAQTYDGASVLSSSKNDVQKEIREICPDAGYAHILNLVLENNHLATLFHTSIKCRYNKMFDGEWMKLVNYQLI